jgi:hypothetical protein
MNVGGDVMARTACLTRREGRYYVQARLVPHVAEAAGRTLYRASLRTADYRQARQRLIECMTCVHRMNHGKKKARIDRSM